MLWLIIFVWFAISVAILSISFQWGIVAFAVSFGPGYGGIVYIMRKRLRLAFTGLARTRFAAFLLTALSVSVFEELYVYALGNRVAIQDIWLDIVIVPLQWAAWFSVWYLFISRKYSFSESEALLTAGFTGILFEYVGNGRIFADPVTILIFLPLTVLIYASIFILPMQFIDFTGSKNTLSKYPAGILLPYISSIPVALLLYLVLL